LSIRWHIIFTLWRKEIWRQLANRGSLCLAALLVVAALLLPLFQPTDTGAAPAAGVDFVFVDYWRDDDWVRHLRQNVPADLRRHIKFRDINQVALPNDLLTYPASAGAIQMRLDRLDDGKLRRRISVWHPADGSMAVFETWFWRESARYFQHQAAAAPRDSLFASDPDFRADFEQDHAKLKRHGDMRSSIASALILFALFFSCVYLMPSLMCEERERGVLLAQALSPASSRDILAAKFLFYAPAGMGLAVVLAGLAMPGVLLEPLFWPALLVAAAGFTGIGVSIASLAKTQRAASMGALCYLLVVTLLLFLCRQSEIPGLPFFALEYHCPLMLSAVLTHSVFPSTWIHLAAAAALAGIWIILAMSLFRRRGWQ
jgi:hypothetical protein